MNDVELLNSYASAGSQDAFTQLVQRHVNLVYSVALRSTRDPHLADDVTQAVFLVLAKKARSIRNPALLPAWLMSTTRYAANNARRQEFHRRNHEQRAAAMRSETYNPSEPGSDISPLLDHSLQALSPSDRTAIILRYIHGKSAREIGMDLGVSEETAQKRLSRAMDKIRAFLSRRGVSRPADSIGLSLGERYLHAAPETLTSLIIARSMSTAVTAATSASALADATLKTIAWAQAKFLAAVCAGCLLLAGSVAVMAVNSPGPARAESPHSQLTPSTTPVPSTASTIASLVPATQPAPSEVLLLPNDTFGKVHDQTYDADIDPDTLREGGPPALLLESTTASPTDSRGSLRSVEIKPFAGKRIRFSAWIKSNSLGNWGGLMININDDAGHRIAFDDMQSRGITGSSDWTKAEIVCDVAPGAKDFALGLHMHGGGQIFMDDARVEAIDKSIPATDDTQFHMYTAVVSNYASSLDPNTQRNGHPTFCITSSAKPTKSWAWYGANNHFPGPYLGHHIRVTGWIMTEKVTGSVRLSVWAFDPQGKLICIDDPSSRRIIKGTTGWKKYDLTATVPAALDHMDPGLNLFGNGKVWIDDFHYELIPDDDSGL